MKARPDSRAELNRIAGIDVLNGLRNVNLITFLSQLSTLKTSVFCYPVEFRSQTFSGHAGPTLYSSCMGACNGNVRPWSVKRF